MEKYLEDEPYLTINRIPLDDTLDIKGKLTESKSPTEGLITFDIIFDAIVPKTDEEIKIIVNIEAQKTTETINYRADSIQEYGLTEKIIHGNFRDEHQNYDLIKIIVLNLGKRSTSHKLLNLLYLLFMDVKKTEEKNLAYEYKIELMRDMKGELEKMGGLMEPLLEIAAEEVAVETKKNTLVENIRNLMETLNLTAKQAMDALKIPADEQKEYMALI